MTTASAMSWRIRGGRLLEAREERESALEGPADAGRAGPARDRFVDAMRAWYREGKPLGKWTIPYLLRHTAYHVLDHTWELQDQRPDGRHDRRVTRTAPRTVAGSLEIRTSTGRCPQVHSRTLAHHRGHCSTACPRFEQLSADSWGKRAAHHKADRYDRGSQGQIACNLYPA